MPRPGRYREAMIRLRAEAGGRCLCPGCAECMPAEAPCARTLRLEFAHLHPTGLRGRGRGRADRYQDIRRNPQAYRLLCRDCHRLFDRERGDAGGLMPGLRPEAYEGEEDVA